MQVIETPCHNGMASNLEPQLSSTEFLQNPSTPESNEASESYSSQKVPLKSSEGSMMNHEDTLEVLQTFTTQNYKKVSQINTNECTKNIMKQAAER